MELSSNYTNKKTIAIFLSTALILITIIRLNYPFPKVKYPYYSSREDVDIRTRSLAISNECDIFSGEWISDPDAPYYTNRTCWAIHEHQNCIKYGRPDTEFLKWKWRPYGCELPLFNPYQFLDMLRDKTMAFVGDSVGRNQMQSLICLLSRVEYPIDLSPTKDEEHYKRWHYVNYNFTLAFYWAPFLVRSTERNSDGPTHTGLFNLYLDEPEPSWAHQIDPYDYVVLNAGHWFTRTSVYHLRRRPIGCRFCQLGNLTDLPITVGYRRALRTAFETLNRKRDFRGVVLLRTFAPSHFEGGAWNDGGNCLRRAPAREMVLGGANLEMYMVELEEYRRAVKEGTDKRKKYGLLDVTQAMVMRPDGHPSRYGHWPNEKVTLYNDCVHWCLPGPIDTWADFLIHVIRMEIAKTGNSNNKKGYAKSSKMN